MDTANGYGKSINLGMQFDYFTQDFCFFYDTIDLTSLHSTIYESTAFMLVLEKILSNPHKRFYVVKDSKYFDILHTHILSGTVELCDCVESVYSNKNSFVFIDETDEAFGKVSDLLKLYNKTPAWIITTRKIISILSFFDGFVALSKKIETITKFELKKLYFLACSTQEYQLGSVLLLLCHSIYGCIHHAERIYGSTNPLDINVVDLEQFNLDKEVSCVILNCFGSTNRRYLTFNSKLTYYFIYGKKRVQSNECHDKKPFFVWFYPHAGTGRIAPILDDVAFFLGLNGQKGIYTYLDGEYTKYSAHDNEKALTENSNTLVRLFHSVPNNSVIALHDSVYDVASILEQTDAKMIVTVRDMRDMVVSNVNWFYGARIRYGHESLEDIAVNFMKTQQAYPAAGRFLLYPGGLSKVTSELRKIKNYKNVFIIKFEDVHKSALKAYLKLFDDFGLTQDPYWVDEVIIPKLKKRVFDLNPHNFETIAQEGTAHQLRHAGPGGWKKAFTPEMKKYFKDNDNSILEVFGYEESKDW